MSNPNLNCSNGLSSCSARRFSRGKSDAVMVFGSYTEWDPVLRGHSMEFYMEWSPMLPSSKRRWRTPQRKQETKERIDSLGMDQKVRCQPLC